MDTSTATDAIELLTRQHRRVEQLWTALEAAGPTSPTAAAQTRELVKLLSQHDAIETMFLYPALRQAEGGDRSADNALHEHQQVRELLKRVDTGDPTDPATFAALCQALEAVQQHVQEEEAVLFPTLRQVRDDSALRAMGKKMAEGMKVAPTHPHPSTPNNPIGAAVAGAVTGIVDRARDALADRR